MKFQHFVDLCNLLTQSEVDKISLLAFYYLKTENIDEFTRDNIRSWYSELSIPMPNLSRLFIKLSESRKFIRGKTPNSYKLHAVEIARLNTAYPQINIRVDEIVCTDSVLPEVLYVGTRGFIESIAKQINASYESSIYDGCAVLIRRLTEIMLILSYENLHIDNEIRDGNRNYVLLDDIIRNAVNNTTLSLSRNTKQRLDDFRKIGNFSAHKIFYNCSRRDIQDIIIDYRAAIQELLYKSGIRI